MPDAATQPLSDRDRTILRLVVRRFVETAAPVGSKAVAEEDEIDLSSASVRAAMSRLEAAGYLDHPHTSAGRVPTQLGYRTYVDELMDARGLSNAERQILRESMVQRFGDLDALTRETSRLLGQLTSLLGVVLTPRLASGTLERLHVVPLSSTRVLFVMDVSGSVVRTVLAELDVELPRLARTDGLDRVVSQLNERLAGLSLEELRRTGADRLADLADEPTGVVRLVLRDVKELFADESGQAQLGGAELLATQPEFRDPDRARAVIEMLGNQDAVVDLMEQSAYAARPGRAIVRIGAAGLGGLEAYSIVAATYRLGDTTGRLGVIGPTRMDYPHTVALVEYAAELFSRGTL